MLTHRVYDTPYGKRMIQVLEAPGIMGPLVQSVFLPDGEDYVEFESWWVMGQTTHPEGTYVHLPLRCARSQARASTWAGRA